MEETLPLIQFTRTRTSAHPGSMHVLVVLLLFFCLQLQLGHRPTHARHLPVFGKFAFLVPPRQREDSWIWNWWQRSRSCP